MGPREQLVFGWAWILMGLLSGVALGLGFHKAGFMGGYDGWRRRLARLGHIAFFGTGLLNLFAALTWRTEGLPDVIAAPAATALIIGAVAMPTVCFLSAWRQPFRHLFAIPVFALISGVVLMLVALTYPVPNEYGLIDLRVPWFPLIYPGVLP